MTPLKPAIDVAKEWLSKQFHTMNDVRLVRGVADDSLAELITVERAEAVRFIEDVKAEELAAVRADEKARCVVFILEAAKHSKTSEFDMSTELRMLSEDLERS